MLIYYNVKLLINKFIKFIYLNFSFLFNSLKLYILKIEINRNLVFIWINIFTLNDVDDDDDDE